MVNFKKIRTFHGIFLHVINRVIHAYGLCVNVRYLNEKKVLE